MATPTALSLNQYLYDSIRSFLRGMTSLSTINISVRNLVEFVMRSGSIDSRYRSSKRAVEGTKIHSIVQKNHKRIAKLSNLTYDSEVSVNVTGEYKEFTFDIDGRIDGLVEEFNSDGTKKILHIEEIKSTSDIDSINVTSEHWHFAQAKCYGYMYALSESFPEIKIHLTYCQLETYDEKTFEEKYQFNDLKDFFFDLLEKYYKWQKLYDSNIVKRNISLKELSFPFENFRKGQRDFAAAVYKTLFSKKKLFAQAPTGTGKTISTIFPSLKFVGEKNLYDVKIFYATAKTITRQNAQDIIKKMKQKGLFLKCVSITAKEKICPCDDKICTPEKCRYAKGHFDRVNNALFELISNEELITKDIVLTYSEKFTVCPFELTLDATIFSDFIICDYNYIFDPKVQLKRFFGNGEKGDYIVLVDEAHNLSDRAREMFSAELSKSEISSIMKDIKDKDAPIYKAFAKLNHLISNIKKNVGNEKALISKKYPEELIFTLSNVQSKCDKWLSNNENTDYYENVLNVYFKVLDFIRISEFFSPEYTVISFYNNDDFTVKLLCINPSELLAVQEKNFISSVFFSATLTPLNYFLDILGGEKIDNSISTASPFKKENLEIIIDTSISTKYKDREKNINILCEKISYAINKKTGNHFVFFPSYEYMEKTAEIFIEKNKELNVCVQARNLMEDEKIEFLEKFTENPTDTFDAFAVMGGIFSEGIDLTGDKLCGAVIVGVGLPLITVERDIIKEYYNQKNINGFDYAYTYPGFNKVLQATGRVIRTETDTGYIMLIDSRYGEYRYKKMFPSHWKT